MNNVFDGNSKKVTLIRVLESVFIGLVTTAIIIGIFGLPFWMDVVKGNIEFSGTILLFSIFLFLLLFFMNFGSDCHFLVAKINCDSILVSKDGTSTKVIKIFENDEFFMRKDKIFCHPWALLKIPERGAASLIIHSITENPKIRNVSCFVEVIAKREIATLQQLVDTWGIEKVPDWEIKIQSLLYDFAESFSIQLGKLFNPLDDEQQKEFVKMIHNFFDEKLIPAGLQVKYANFGIV
ncbi:MAG TPA: hypothetical protein P5052_01610 [Candidatus Paceibacterota bacterium]|nr:hypothetical protein [Candidatus Paceibacterota bacterium]HRZ29459.1 hypothetical protein [Candidatus Paceibacterota bacterium]